MKKLLAMIIVVALAAVGLSACGVAATLKGSVASLGSSPNLQVHLTATVAVAGASATVAQDDATVKDFSVDLRLSNPSGGSISSGGNGVGSEILVNAGGNVLADLRIVGTNIYVEVDPTALSNVPGLNISSSELAAVQLFLGGRWFELSQSLLASLQHVTSAEKAQEKSEGLLEKKIFDEVAALIESTPYTTLPGGGYRETGTLASVVNAVWPVIASVTPGLKKPGSVPGTYALSLSLSGATTTGGSLSITAPGDAGVGTVTVNATVTHDDVAIVTPTGATVITPALLKEFEGTATGASATLGSSLG